jgi:hypothetical protein
MRAATGLLRVEVSMKLSRRSFALGLISAPIVAACGVEVSNGPYEGPAPTPTPAPDPPIVILPEAGTNQPAPPLEGLPPIPWANETHAVHRVFYSWTTAEQIDELRDGAPFLTRTVNAQGSPGTFYSFMAGWAAGGDETAKFFLREEFQKSRYGWVNPLSYALVGTKSYPFGDRLLRLSLKSEALIAVVSWTSKARVFAIDGAEVSFEFLRSNPGRLGAIFFDDRGLYDHPEASCYPGGALREFIFPNESMIEAWEYATVSVLADVAWYRRAVDDLLAITRANPTSFPVSYCYEPPPPAAPVPKSLIDAFALVTEIGTPTLTTLAATLAALPDQGAPLVGPFK